jgi:hypothetical protein
MTHTVATPQPAESDSNEGSLPDLQSIDRYNNRKLSFVLDTQGLYAFEPPIRLGEHLILDRFYRGLASGNIYTSIGEGFIAISMVRTIKHTGDTMLSNHRNHCHYPIYSGGTLDSTAILALVVWYEETYNFTHNQEEINIDDLGPTHAMADLQLARKDG